MSPETQPRYLQGLAKLREIDGHAGERVVASLADIAPDFARYLIEFPFGDIYSRPGLDLRSREIAVVAALTALGKLGKADPQRLMVLRTASNFTIQPDGKDAAQSLSAEAMELSALQPSVDAAFLLGSQVVDEIAGNWPRYRAAVPVGVGPAKDAPDAPVVDAADGEVK